MSRFKIFQFVIGTCFALTLAFSQVTMAQVTATQLVITDFPETVEEYIDFSFTIEAQDENGDTVPNYTGTVKFYSDTDPNAELPSEYTFTVDDSGEKVFAESFFFTADGPQELSVEDVDNDDLADTVILDITAQDEGGEADTITLTSPTAGSTTNSTITARGKTTPGVTVTILDGAETLGTVDADAEGNFEFQTGALSDGTYNIKVTTESAESQVITVTVTTQAPSIDFFEITPSSVTPGSKIIVTTTLISEAREVKAIISGIQTRLTQDQTNPLLYEGEVTAPNTPGDYEITLLIEDELGNIANNVTTDTTLTVLEDGNEVIVGNNDPTTLNVPSQITAVQATGADQRINLTWQAATAEAGVKNYAIYYGTDTNNLSLKVETLDDSTNWYIPNLANGQTYYFQVFAIDNNGNRSDQGSQIIAAIPDLTEPTTLHGSGQNQIQVNQTTESGPGGLLALAFGSLFSAKLIRRRK